MHHTGSHTVVASRQLVHIQLQANKSKASCHTSRFLSPKLIRYASLEGVSYQANDISVGDLDGDGKLDIVVKRLLAYGDSDGTGSGSSPLTVRHTVLYEAYKLDGTFMWRVCSGPNIILGNSSSFAIADFDGDGKAEMAIKTGEGTIFGRRY